MKNNLLKAKLTSASITLTPKALLLLSKIDESLIGTDDYMGIAWFWNYEYRHVLRNLTFKKRRKCHNALLKAGLNVSEESPEHKIIINRYVK